MSYFASLQDQRTQTAIEDWKATANVQVDEIGGWRDADTDKLSRYWADGCTIPRTGPPRMPNGFYGQTAFIMGQIANRYRNLDPSPLQAIYGAVAAWYEDRAADRIPPQASLYATLEQAMLVLNAIECDIASRMQTKQNPPVQPKKSNRRTLAKSVEMHAKGELVFQAINRELQDGDTGKQIGEILRGVGVSHETFKASDHFIKARAAWDTLKQKRAIGIQKTTELRRRDHIEAPDYSQLDYASFGGEDDEI